MKLEEQESDLLARATAEWKAAQILRTDPAWNGEPSVSHFVEIQSSKPEFESKLIELLNSDNQLIVAYSLFTLSLMKSSVLENLPQELLKRKDKVTISTGSFRDQMELGAFASHIQKEQRSKGK